MSAAAAPRPDTHGHPVARVSHLDAMDHLRDPACEALVWDRAVPSGIAAALDDLPIGPLDNLRVTTPVDHVGAWVKESLTDWNWPTPSARAWLQSDITTLARAYAQFTDWHRLHLRLEIIRDDACRRFHRDHVGARLICTYAGPGTELALGETADEAQVIDPVPTGHPVVLKGKLWPDGLRGTVLHRSPPLSDGTGTGQPRARLVMVLNEAR